MGSPGTGRQHLASRSITSSTPSTLMPNVEEAAVLRGASLRSSSSAAGDGSSTADSPSFSRCISFWVTVLAEIFAWPSAM